MANTIRNSLEQMIRFQKMSEPMKKSLEQMRRIQEKLGPINQLSGNIVKQSGALHLSKIDKLSGASYLSDIAKLSKLSPAYNIANQSTILHLSKINKLSETLYPFKTAKQIESYRNAISGLEIPTFQTHPFFVHSRSATYVDEGSIVDALAKDVVASKTPTEAYSKLETLRQFVAAKVPTNFISGHLSSLVIMPFTWKMTPNHIFQMLNLLVGIYGIAYSTISNIESNSQTTQYRKQFLQQNVDYNQKRLEQNERHHRQKLEQDERQHKELLQAVRSTKS